MWKLLLLIHLSPLDAQQAMHAQLMRQILTSTNAAEAERLRLADQQIVQRITELNMAWMRGSDRVIQEPSLSKVSERSGTSD